VVLGLPALATAQSPDETAPPFAATLETSINEALHHNDAEAYPELRRTLRDLAEDATAPQENRARAEYELGRIEERFGSQIDAAYHYDRAYVMAPSARFARHASARARMLAAEISVGVDAEGRQSFERVRRASLDEVATSRESVRSILSSTQDLTLQSELRFWLAHDAHVRRRQPREAWDHYAAILAIAHQPSATYRAAVDGLTILCGPARRIQETRALINALNDDHPTLFDAYERHLIDEELWDQAAGQAIRVMAWFVFPMLLGAFAYTRGWRAFTRSKLALWRPWRGALFILLVFIGAGVIADLYTEHAGEAVASCAPGVIVVFVLAGAIRWSDPTRRPTRWQAAFLATLVTACTICAVYLTLYVQGMEDAMGL